MESTTDLDQLTVILERACAEGKKAINAAARPGKRAREMYYSMTHLLKLLREEKADQAVK